MSDRDDGTWALPEDGSDIPGSLWWTPAFTCRPLHHRPEPLAAGTAACGARLVKPSSRLIFTPWVFGQSIRTMHA